MSGSLNEAQYVFQSLRRDSVGSHIVGIDLQAHDVKVSIPQAGFCRFTPGGFGRVDAPANGFNPSGGIL